MMHWKPSKSVFRRSVEKIFTCSRPILPPCFGEGNVEGEGILGSCDAVEMVVANDEYSCKQLKCWISLNHP